jgi:DNA polymerase III delta subunit
MATNQSPAAVLKELTNTTTGAKEPPLCIVITAPDLIRRSRTLKYLLEHFTASYAISAPTSFTFSDQNRLSIAPFLQNLSEPSLFQPHNFGVIKGIESAKAADVEPISKFLESAPPGVLLFIVGESLPNTPTFKKKLESHAKHLAFSELKGVELRRWVERELKQEQIASNDHELIEDLITLCDEDPTLIAQLIQKFSLYLDGAPATREALRLLEPGRAHASDFELAETLLTKNRAQCEALVLQLTNQGSNPYMVIGLLTKTFNSLLQVRAMLDRGIGINDIRNQTGIIPWQFQRYLALAKTRSTAKFSEILSALNRADFRLKDRSLGPATILSEFAATVAG